MFVSRDEFVLFPRRIAVLIGRAAQRLTVTVLEKIFVRAAASRKQNKDFRRNPHSAHMRALMPRLEPADG
jgi:hypothetical protein